MQDIIQLLPDSVANQIAAGEVIQRPASVIKELVENSVDAGADTISVCVVDAGRTSIQVVDNGKGMSDTDARLSFERHATSKIRKADDLFNLHSMGFRGEALASIAAVAQVELRTRREEDVVGTQVCIAGSRVISQEPVACPVGCNFKVENLFYNVPARRKFLKTNATELNNILAAFERIVLVYPDISFSFSVNGNETLSLRRTNLRQRILDVFGKRVNSDLLPVSVKTSVCTISGFVGKPESARKKGALQYFFVNGRYMRHPYFHKAVQNAFERLVPAGEQIPYFLYFDVPASDIDVNIHPVKTEIKFENEQAIWQILAAAVRDALGRWGDVPAIEFDVQGRPDIPAFDASAKASAGAPNVKYDGSYNPFSSTAAPRTAQSQNGRVGRSSVPSEWQSLYDGLLDPHLGNTVSERQSDLFGMSDTSGTENSLSSDSDTSPSPTSPVTGIGEDISPSHYQYKGRYIVSAVKSGLMLIDQHRAHVRILYDRYMASLRQHNAASQKVLFPEMVQFAPSDQVTLQAIMPQLEAAGFIISDMGAGNYAIGGIPAGTDGINQVRLLQEIVAEASGCNLSSSGMSGGDAENHAEGVADEINHSLAMCLARNAAITVGEILSSEEMEGLINQLFSCTNCNYTPSGKNIIAIIRQSDIDELFH